MNPKCDYYCKTTTIGWRNDDILEKSRYDDDLFVIQYQAMTHAKGQMTGQVLENTEKFLRENEERYLKLTNKTI
jgi:hypothetical protein